MKLYFSPGACSLASHIALREIGAPFEIEKVDHAAKKTAGGADFLSINPKGYVPVLEAAPGEVLTEGPAILTHLADSHPEAGLAPRAGTIERFRVNEWITFISSEVHKGAFATLFNPASPDSVKSAAHSNLAKRLLHVETSLADGRAFLTGATFTIADAYLFTVVNWTKFVAFDLEPFPRIRAYQDRVAARPAVQAALGAEGLLAA